MSEVIQFQIENIDNAHFSLLRLSDDEYFEYRRHTIPISSNSMMLYQLNRMKADDTLNLAEFYVALKMLTGESGRCYDDWKSSFEFSFLMKIKKEKKEFEYMLSISDYRGNFEFAFYRCVEEESSLNGGSYHKPFDQEFSQNEIDQFILFFYGFLRGYLNSVQKHYDEPFLHTIDSNCVLFGYLNQEFFEEYYEDHEDYEKAVKSKRKELRQKEEIPDARKTTKLILDIPWEFQKPLNILRLKFK